MRLLKPSDMKKMPWKNGGGITFEVAISPAAAQVGLLDFDWRVSIAHVDAEGRFSLFPGYDRQLVVWRGTGLSINGVQHATLEPFAFAGETAIEAKLTAGPVRDFGVICKRGAAECRLTAHRLGENESFEVSASRGECFVVCARGELRIGEFYLNPGDVVHSTAADSMTIKALETSAFAIAVIR